MLQNRVVLGFSPLCLSCALMLFLDVNAVQASELSPAGLWGGWVLQSSRASEDAGQGKEANLAAAAKCCLDAVPAGREKGSDGSASVVSSIYWSTAGVML